MLGSGYVRFTGRDYVENCPIFGVLQDTFTIELWVKPEEDIILHAATGAGIAGIRGQRFAVAAGHTGTENCAGIGVSVGRNGISVYEHTHNHLAAVLTYETILLDWTHIAVVYDDQTPCLLVNGQLAASGIRSVKSTVFPSGQLGGLQPYGFYVGDLDDVRIWNYARHEDEIRSEMYKELTGTERGLFAYWKFNEGVGVVAHDSTEHSNHGIKTRSCGYSVGARRSLLFYGRYGKVYRRAKSGFEHARDYSAGFVSRQISLFL